MSGISGTSVQGDSDSPIRVVVTPTQSSYFAGEPFSVSITFTNTRSAESLPSRSYSHKRGAHSISSAPLARPPTSPGTPRKAVPITPARGQNGGVKIARKGLIGKAPSLPNGADELPDVLEQSRKRLFAKSRSLSVDVGHPHEVPPDSKPESAQYIRAYDETACEFIYFSTKRTKSKEIKPRYPLPFLPKHNIRSGDLKLCHEITLTLEKCLFSMGSSHYPTHKDSNPGHLGLPALPTPHSPFP